MRFYTALKGYFGDREWQSWEPALRDREEAALCEYREKLHTDMMFCKFCQYEFFRQWKALKRYANSRGVSIIGDLPFYVAADSADAWAHRELFLLGEDGTPEVVAGAPPDAYSEDGQKWGSPIYDWSFMEENGFAWWQARILENAELFNMIRLDHFTGIVKYYTVPSEAENGKNGKWRRGPGKKLTDAIEQAAGDIPVIVEDVGAKNPMPGVKKTNGENRLGGNQDSDVRV